MSENINFHSSQSYNLNLSIGTSCYADDVIKSYTNFMVNKILTVDSYYDPTDIDNPIKRFINVGWQIYSTGTYNEIVNIKIIPTIVKFLDGTTEIVYSTNYDSDQLGYTTLHPTILYGIIDLSPYQYYIEEFVDYQPQVSKISLVI